jgi:hypothetical protein
MPWRRIIMPSGCAESACPKDQAYPLGLSAHLVIMEIFCFLCCGHRLGLLRPQEFSLPPTHEFTLAITRCADKPRGCAESSCHKHSAHPLGLSAHLERRKLLAFLSCCGARGASDLVGSPSYTITSSRTSIPRCPSVASLYRVDAPKAPVLRIKRIHLACRRISL